MAEFRLDIVGNSESMTNALDNVSKGLQEVGQDAIEISKKTQAAFGNNGGVEQFGKSLKDQVLVLARLEAEMKKIIAAKKTAFDGKEAAALDTQLKGVTKTLTALDAEMGKTDDTAKSLKAQLRENKEILSQLEDQGLETTDTFFQLAVQTGKLQDQIGDTNERIKFFASDTKGIDGLIAVTKIAAGGFAVAQGAAAIFGAENENVQKALLKVNAAMAVLNGLQEIQQALQKSSAARITIETALRKAKIFVLGSETLATEGLTTAQIVAANAAKVLRAALLATGIGAVVFLIGTLISAASAMSDFKKETENTTDEIKKQDEALQNLQRSLDFNTKKNLANAKKLGASNELLRNIEREGYKENLKLLQDDIDKKTALRDKALAINLKTLKDGNAEEIKESQASFEEAKQALKNSQTAKEELLNDYTLFTINSQTEANKELEDNNKKFEDSQEKKREKAKQKKQQDEADRIDDEAKAQRILQDMMKAFNDFNNDNMKNQFDIEKAERDKIIKNNLDFLNSVQEVKELELDIEFETGSKSIAETKRIAEEKLKLEIEFAQKKLDILKSSGGDEAQIRAIELAIAKGKNQLDLLAKDGDNTKFLEAIGLGNLKPEDIEGVKESIEILKDSLKDILNGLLDVALENNDKVLENLENQILRTRDNISKQNQLQNEGRSNNLKEEEENLKQLEAQKTAALERQKKLQKQQLAIDSAQQLSSLITASANIFAALSPSGPAGVAIAVATIAAMFSAFALSKVRAVQLINKQTLEKGGKVKGRRHYEGGERYYSEDGNLVEIEAGEYVTRRKQSDKYATLLDAINSDTLHRMDLQQLLRHTGVSLSPTEVEGFKTTVNNNERAAIAYKVKLESEFNPEIKGLRDDFNTFRSETKNKKQITFENGYIIEKIGSRTIRTKI